MTHVSLYEGTRIRGLAGLAQSLLVGVVNTADRRWRSAPASRIEKTKAKFSRRTDPETSIIARAVSHLPRTCLQLSRMIAATNWTAARKFRASLS